MNGELKSFSASWRKPSKATLDRLWLVGLTIAAAVLLLFNLGNVPLKDWDEGLVAQVAKEIWQAPADRLTWLYPTLWGEPYYNKPPLIHALIATLYHLAGVNEWTARLPSASLTLISVPLLYGVGRELFNRRLPALFAAMVYLTSLPIVRNGRFAMLDGAILCFLLLMVFCLLRARRDYRYLLGTGIALGLLCLTKGVLVAGLLGSIGLVFLCWDTPRLLVQPYLWLGLGLGCLPAGLWYLAQWLHYGQLFWANNLLEQSLQRIWTDVESNGAPPWYYLLELLKYGAPWILFLPAACQLAWANRNLSWAKLTIVWSGIYFGAISLMATKLPWYILPLYPAIALLVGAQLAELWQQGRQIGLRQTIPDNYAVAWMPIFSVLAAVSWGGMLYFLLWAAPAESDLGLVLAIAGGTFTMAAFLVARQTPQFMLILAWGTYLALLALMSSPHWAWEIAEAYPVRPVAAMIQTHVPPAQAVYTSYPNHRPSLNFYSQHLVRPSSEKQLRQQWRKEQTPYLLVDQPTLITLDLKSAQIVGRVEDWSLITKAKI